MRYILLSELESYVGKSMDIISVYFDVIHRLTSSQIFCISQALEKKISTSIVLKIQAGRRYYTIFALNILH